MPQSPATSVEPGLPTTDQLDASGHGASGTKRVLIIASSFWPEQTGCSQTTYEFARFMASRGMKVEVVTSLPFYPQWSIWPGYRGRIWMTEETDGIRIRRAWHLVSPQPSTLGRILHELSLTLLSLPRMVSAAARADAVYVVSPALSYAVIGLCVSALFGCRRILAVKDVMPDAAVELGMMRNPLMIGLTRRLARMAYGLAHEIHTLAEGMQRRIQRECAVPAKVRIVPDTIDADELRPVREPEANAFREQFVPAGTFAVLHSGNMGRKQDLDLLLRAAERLRAHDDVAFLVFGDGADRERFLDRRAALGLTNVAWHPLQDRWMLRHMLSGADVVLVSQREEVVDIVVPSKLLTSLAAGAMIVAAASPQSETARIIRDSGGGILIDAGDDEALANRILELRRGAIAGAPYRERARAFAIGRFDRSSVFGPLVDALVRRDAVSDGAGMVGEMLPRSRT